MTVLIVDANNLTKVCRTCKEEKPISEFHKHKTTRDRLNGECKKCHRARAQKWAEENRDRAAAASRRHRAKLDPEVAAERVRRSNYKAAYGITPEDYDRMFEEQKGLCAICLEPPVKMRLAVDHNKKTGKVRQLLCGRCNTSIGLLREDVEIMARAIVYIERHAA